MEPSANDLRGPAADPDEDARSDPGAAEPPEQAVEEEPNRTSFAGYEPV